MIYVIGALIFVNVVLTICIFSIKSDLHYEKLYTKDCRNTIENLQSIRSQLDSENSKMKKDIKEIRQISIRG